MAISNVNSNSRPGICSSTTRPSAPFEGQLIYETDTNRVLIWDNAAWVMIADTDQPPGLQLVTQSSTVTSGEMVITNCFSSEYDSYKIVLSNMLGNTAMNTLLDLYTGSAYTANGFYCTGIRVPYNSTSVSGVNAANNAATTETGIILDSSAKSGGTIEIQNPFLTARTTFQITGADPRTGGNGSSYLSGFHNADTSYTGFRFRGSGGNITSGTIRVYGYRN